MDMDDDFKINMNDIKDIVSELFGEKVEKVKADDAKKILKEDMEEFMSSGLDNVSEKQLTESEEEMLKEYENEHGAGTASAAAAADGEQRADSVDIDALKKQVEAETRRKVEEETREKMKMELETEKTRKKEEIMKKIETSKQQSLQYQQELAEKAKAGRKAGKILNYSEIITIINMFDQAQKILANLLAKLLKRRPVETMFLKTLEKSMEKYPDVLRKVDTNQHGKVRTDGTIEIARLASNINALKMTEDKKTEYFPGALQDIFEERLIATELAVGIETKEDILSSLMAQTEKIFAKKNISSGIRGFFNEKVLPNTTMKSGD